MADQDPHNTDGSSIKPVSSLLSHFEGLTQIKTSNNGPQSPRDSPRFQKLADRFESIQSPGSGRASLDLPRPDSPWSLTASSRQDKRPSHSHTPEKAPSRPGSPGKQASKRPMSMLVQSSPQLVPSVSLESPRSPPRGYLQNRSGSRSPESKTRTLLATQSRASKTPSPSRPTSRPNTPRSEVGGASQQQNLGGLSSLTPGSSDRASRNRSIPPPVNRAEKPKIQPKTTLPPSTRIAPSLAPERPESASENRVSPFSTPPSSGGSSPEKTFLPPRKDSVPGERLPRPLIRTNTEPIPIERGEVPDPITRSNDARALGFSRTKPVHPRSDNKAMAVFRRVSPNKSHKSPDRQKISATHIVRSSTEVSRPTPSDPKQAAPAMPYRDARNLGFSSSKTSLNDAEEDRPGLPPRRVPNQPPPRPPNHAKVSASNIKPPEIDRSTKFNAHGKALRPAQQAPVQAFPPPPKRNTDPQEPHSQLGEDIGLNRRTKASNDSDVEEDMVEEPSVMKNEYPDTSQANRRPPYVMDGRREIPSKFDSRVFDVCGPFVCMTGFTTRVWDLSINECVMNLNHGETVKILSVAFKPGKSVEEEGRRLWIGNTLGEVHEIDIATQSSVASTAAHGRREVIKILRQQKNMWTLDEEGKLFVWTADESSCPSLRYSHHSHRVSKGHTFSMCVKDKLWLATGKEIRVYKPGNESTFHVLQAPLVPTQSGDITSGSYTGRFGGQVYFGHTDGKVSIYSTKDYTFVKSVKASDYKINALSFVGDWLWAAYKTGKIYVYDTSTTPWKVKKDWRAHDGPTASMLLDPSSVWTLGRLQVASLGHDQVVRLWDGMLEEDWMESWMQSNDVEYCRFREVRASVITWNVGAIHPFDVRSDFICDAIHVEDPPDIIVFGFQELVDLEDKSVTASKNYELTRLENFLGFAKKKDPYKAEHISKVYREWRDYLGRCINRFMASSASYSELHTSSLIGLFSCVFVRQDERQNIRNLQGSEVKCGMKGHYGNKGALISRFMLDDSSLCFINCHLAAGQTQTSHRNNDIASILEADCLSPEPDPDVRSSVYVSGGDGTQILDHEICILNGDLNYRIDSMPRDTVINYVQRNELAKLLERDQMMISRRRVAGFRLSPFTEAPITFAPTYKYDVGTDRYDTSEKKRSPAWCDRLLYRGIGRVKQTEYRRHEVRNSDHRPVSGTFKIRVKTIDTQRRKAALQRCQELFAGEKRRLAQEASVEYLMNSLGLAEKEARAAISAPRA
ncbi:MAG: hypothetical protein Q9227_000779 [Pyrenula ochraceoflavens]